MKAWHLQTNYTKKPTCEFYIRKNELNLYTLLIKHFGHY